MRNDDKQNRANDETAPRRIYLESEAFDVLLEELEQPKPISSALRKTLEARSLWAK